MMDGTVTVGDPEGLFSPGERSVPPVSLRSVQQYRSQDEYVVVMKEDLAEWMSELYEMTITADDLFDRLDTGILLCRYACIVDDAIKSRDIRSEPVVYRERGVEPGSFQARVNVAAFLAWCRRRPLQMPDDVLFETGDLICQPPAERNERQVALSLLEVGRRSAALGVGLPAPQLVRLEAEIDAELRADDSALIATTDSHVDNYDEQDSLSNAPQSPAATTPHSAARKTRCIRPPSVNISNRVEEPTVSTRNIRPPSVNVSNRIEEAAVTTEEAAVSAEETTQSEKRGSAWQRRRYRPIIPVDMMSLDEMVRQILARCTCPNQYPMVRVSEGKYRIGDNLTLIFVRILRQHVMVRIGGGWNTLDNYLARCDPCRCQKNAASTDVLTTSTIPTTTLSSRTTSNFPTTSSTSSTPMTSFSSTSRTTSNSPTTSTTSITPTNSTTSTTPSTSFSSRTTRNCPTTSSTSAIPRITFSSRTTSNFPTTSSTSTTPTTIFSTGQSAISEAVSEHQRHVAGSGRLNSSCSDLPSSPSPSPPSSSKVTTATVTSSGRQRPIPRRLSDLSLTSQALPVSDATNCRSVHYRSLPTTPHNDNAVTRETGDVTAAAESLSSHATASCCDNVSSVTAGDSVHSTSSPRTSDHHLTVLSSTSSSPSFATADAAVDTSNSCPQLRASDDLQRRSSDSRTRTPVCRPSRIPVPLRLAARSPSQNVTFFLGSAVNRHRRCDSGVDLNLSSPDFD